MKTAFEVSQKIQDAERAAYATPGVMIVDDLIAVV
jgi:hypothetical protein